MQNPVGARQPPARLQHFCKQFRPTLDSMLARTPVQRRTMACHRHAAGNWSNNQIHHIQLHVAPCHTIQETPNAHVLEHVAGHATCTDAVYLKTRLSMVSSGTNLSTTKKTDPETKQRQRTGAHALHGKNSMQRTVTYTLTVLSSSCATASLTHLPNSPGKRQSQQRAHKSSGNATRPQKSPQT